MEAFSIPSWFSNASVMLAEHAPQVIPCIDTRECTVAVVVAAAAAAAADDDDDAIV